MKKSIFIAGIILVVLILSGNMLTRENSYDIRSQLYLVDHSMLRLIPVNYKIENSTCEKAAQDIVDKLIEGQDYNNKILRVIPDISDCISVKVKKRTAYVNLKNKFLDNLTDNKNHQVLCLYSIVNSLTSVDGIDTVQFLIDGEIKKEYIGGIDMREVFIPDYYI